ncbi:MAG: radical SAM protein [Promethearchaeota archaeon]
MHFSLQNGFQYVKNFILNNFTNIKVPYSAQIELTLRCNGRCSFCSIHRLPKSFTQENNEISTKEVKKIISEISDMGILALSFTGGEPTLRKDLPELIYHAGIKHDFITGVATNGYLLPKLFKEYDLEGLDYILMSLDYPSAPLHDKMRGLKVYDKVIQSIEMANKKDIKVIISTVVMKDNLKYLHEICELALNLNCSIEMYPCEDIIRDFPDKSYQVENLDEIIPDISKWANIIRSLRKMYKNILTDPLSVEVIEKGGFGGMPKHHQSLLRCHVAEAYLFVRYDGLIDYPCKIHPIISLDALKYPIFKIYNSKEVREIMKKHDGYDFCNRCRLGCAITSSMPARWKTVYAKYIKGFLDGNLS